MSSEKSKNIEMITGDPKKAIVKLAIPMMVSMLLIMLYNLADSIWVAGLGADALAAIGFITPLFMILIGLGNGIGAGANSLIARNIGADNYKQANNAGLHAILLSVVVSIIFTVLIEVFMVPILEFMGAGNTIGYAMDYSYIIFGFLFIFYIDALSFLIAIQFYIVGFIMIIFGISGLISRMGSISTFTSILVLIMGVIAIALAAFSINQPVYIAIIIGIVLIIEGVALILSN